MSVTVLAPTPALPPVRRPSMWEKMFGNFKLGKHHDGEIEPSLLSPRLMSPASPRMPKTRMASVSTGIDTANITYKRNNSSVAKDLRSSSAPLPQPSSPAKSRAASIASVRSRRSSRARRMSWWRSANPETDEGVPAVPAIDRKFSLFGSHNPDMDTEEAPVPSPTGNRRLSYVPRNAASSFLRTTTPLSAEEKVEVVRSRNGSVADVKHMNDAAPNSTTKFKPTPLNLNNNNDNDSLAAHGMFSMAGACEISGAPYSYPLTPDSLISPRSGAFSTTFAPRSPADTIMEGIETEVVDSAKPSPELSAVKERSEVTVVELLA